jgi:hypothetical protein
MKNMFVDEVTKLVNYKKSKHELDFVSFYRAFLLPVTTVLLMATLLTVSDNCSVLSFQWKIYIYQFNFNLHGLKKAFFWGTFLEVQK